MCRPFSLFFLFYSSTYPVIYTLSLHDALPICACFRAGPFHDTFFAFDRVGVAAGFAGGRFNGEAFGAAFRFAEEGGTVDFFERDRFLNFRSEERRVGKECRSGLWRDRFRTSWVSEVCSV